MSIFYAMFLRLFSFLILFILCILAGNTGKLCSLCLFTRNRGLHKFLFNIAEFGAFLEQNQTRGTKAEFYSMSTRVVDIDWREEQNRLWKRKEDRATRHLLEYSTSTELLDVEWKSCTRNRQDSKDTRDRVKSQKSTRRRVLWSTSTELLLVREDFDESDLEEDCLPMKHEIFYLS